MYAIKFNTYEEKENFERFCNYIGWVMGALYGSGENTYYVQTEDEDEDNAQMYFLYNLGAFMWLNE